MLVAFFMTASAAKLTRTCGVSNIGVLIKDFFDLFFFSSKPSESLTTQVVPFLHLDSVLAVFNTA